MPRVHKQTFKKEFLRLVEIGVLKEVHQSEWGSPMFIIPNHHPNIQYYDPSNKEDSSKMRIHGRS